MCRAFPCLNDHVQFFQAGRLTGNRLPEACKARLEELFHQNQRPDFDAVNALAIEFNESYNAIWFWFRNRRARPKPPPDRTPFHEALEAVYVKERYPKRDELETLAKTWREKYSTVYNWFYRRRKQDQALEEEAVVDNPEFSPRKYRLSAASREVLEDYFNNDEHPNRRALEQLSSELGETYERVYRYFCKRRYQKKQRRLNRDKLSIECKEALEAIYLKEEYPKRQTLESLAKTWNTDYPTLYNWFYRRRYREATKARLSTAVLKVLEAHFEKDPSPRRPVLLQLSTELNRSYDTLYRYFIWRRYKSRKESDMVSKPGRPRLPEPQIQRGRGRPPTKQLLEL
ncbi:hypothetical protein CPB85DRAFT_1280694 [Mucidula mucida]|nr:hypothetical protein CPB85DRAFT_1280694 [Mucidula mucida]